MTLEVEPPVAEILTLALEQKCELYDETYRLKGKDYVADDCTLRIASVFMELHFRGYAKIMVKLKSHLRKTKTTHPMTITRV